MASEELMCVLKFCDDGSFWGAIHLHLLSEIENLINSHEDNLDFIDNLTIGEMCLVKYFVDSGNVKWRRAKVCNVLSSRIYCTKVELFLVDDGTVIVSPLECVRALPLDLAEYPPIAQQYLLKELQPYKQCLKKGWGDIVMCHLKELCAKNDVVNAIIDSNDSVVLYVKKQDAEDAFISFNDYLVKSNLAEVTEMQCEVQMNDAITVEADCVNHSFSSIQCTSHKQVYHETLNAAYVEASTHKTPVSLNSAGLSTCILKELKKIGMVSFTVAQSYGIPYILSRNDTVIVSPTSTGKTLAYLLPLLNIIDSSGHNCKLKLLILVSTSHQAMSVELQAKKIISWVDPGQRFRCCCSHYASEVEAIHCMINGINILISTPSSALRLYEKYSSFFQGISFLVLDDFNALYESFCDEIVQLREITKHSRPQIVVLGSHWSKELHQFRSILCDPACITTCSIEVAIKSHIHLNVVLPCDSKFKLLQKQIVSGVMTAICTSTKEEADSVYQILNLNNWSPVLVTEDNVINYVDIKIAVVSDSVLPSVNFNCRHIIHFSPPFSKVAFRRRLSLLYSALLENWRCSCTILIDESWRKQSILLSEMVKRLDIPVHPIVQKMAKAQIKDKESNKSGYDCCYHLKAWGSCRKYKCSSIHKLKAVSELKSVGPCSNLPIEGVVKAKVYHISNANRLWLSILEHIPPSRGEPPATVHNPIQFKRLSLDLTHYYSIKENKNYHGNPREGCYYGYCSEDGNFFRVQVLKFSQPLGFYFPHVEEARIRLIDVGEVRIVGANELLYLPESFLEVPPRVVEAYLSGIKPKDNDLDWPFQALDYSRQMVQNKVIYGKIGLSCEQTLWLERVECIKLLPGIQVATPVLNPVHDLLKMDLAETNSYHLDRLKEHISACKEVHKSKKKTRYINLKQDAIKVFVTAVDSPSLLYVQSADNVKRLKELEKSLNDTEHHQWLAASASLEVGDICCARFPIDKRWYRGQIIAMDIDKFDILFVDYGDTEWVDSHMVVPLHDSALELPFQAIECSLEYDDDIVWPSDAGDLVWELTRGNVYQMEIKEFRSSNNGEMERCLVLLYDEVIGTDLISLLHNRMECEQICKYVITNNVSDVVSMLKSSRNDAERRKYAEELQYVVMNYPNVMYETDDVSFICQLVSSLSKSSKIQICLLRSLCGLIMLQNKCELKKFNIIPIMKCLKGSSLNVIELILLLLKFLVPCVRDLLSSQYINLLCECLTTWKGLHYITEHVLDILLLLEWDKCYTTAFLNYLATLCDPNFGCTHTAKVIGAIIYKVGYINMKLSPSYIASLLNKENDVMMTICFINLYEHLFEVQNRCLFGYTIAFQEPVLEYIWSLYDKSTPRQPTSLYASLPPTSQKKPILHPRILWSQDDSSVLLALQICGSCKDKTDLCINGALIKYISTSNTGIYQFELILYDSVSSTDFIIKYLVCEVLVKLFKKRASEWPRLIHSSERSPFLAYDITRLDQGQQESVAFKSKYEQFCGEDDSSVEEDEDEQDYKISDLHFLYDI